MKNIAIIPARSGSKGVVDKNIKMILGKPLMAYSIQAAIKAGLFDEVMVSTDSDEYAIVAKTYGASVPFLRSKENATDNANKWDVVKEVLSWYRTEGREFDTFCVLQPTSPLRTEKHIIEAYQTYKSKEAIAVVSVCEMEHTPLWSNVLPENNSINGFINEEMDSSRQTFQTYYRLNGAIYIMDVNEFLSNPTPYRGGGYAYIMSQKCSVDIDNEFDFFLAEEIISKNEKEHRE